MSLRFRYRKLGFDATLRIDSADLEELARDLQSSALVEISPCSQDIEADLVWQHLSADSWRVLLKGQHWGAFPTREDLYLQSDSLLDDLIRERLPKTSLLHAGGVVDPQGRGVVICGTSGSGKTSFVLSCILRGWNWLSDELLCFRQADPCIAEGFRRNFNLKERSFGFFPQTSSLPGIREFAVNDNRKRIRFVKPDELSGGAFAHSGTIHAIVVPEYTSDDIRAIATPLTGPELVQRLAPELRSGWTESLAWLAAIGRSVPAFVLQYHAIADGMDCLEHVVETL